jgi:hypothetical protein
MANGLGSREDPQAVAVFSETSTRQDVVCRTPPLRAADREGVTVRS